MTFLFFQLEVYGKGGVDFTVTARKNYFVISWPIAGEAEVEGWPLGLTIPIRFPTNPRLVWLCHLTLFSLRGPFSDSYVLDV